MKQIHIVAYKKKKTHKYTRPSLLDYKGKPLVWISFLTKYYEKKRFSIINVAYQRLFESLKELGYKEENVDIFMCDNVPVTKKEL